MRGLRVWCTALVLAGAALVSGGLETAQATVLRGSDVATYGGSYDDCGFTVDVAGEFSSPKSKARVGKHDDATAFFGHDNYTRVEVHTRRDTGTRLLIHVDAVVHDIQATRVDGSVFRLTTTDVGKSEIQTGDGTIVYRDSGQIRRVYLLDTLGDSTPGGVLLELLSEDFRGNFPEFDFCSALANT